MCGWPPLTQEPSKSIEPAVATPVATSGALPVRKSGFPTLPTSGKLEPPNATAALKSPPVVPTIRKSMDTADPSGAVQLPVAAGAIWEASPPVNDFTNRKEPWSSPEAVRMM
jgi:hypothetical protein